MNNLNQIHPKATIGKDVHISPFCFIDENVEIGDGTWIGPNVTVFSGARIGKNCKIYPGAVIAGVPQDLKFRGEETTAEIGDHSTIREYVTVNRGTAYANKTVVGANCMLMAYVHVAHDCILGNNIILANNVNLAGHVEIDDFAILEGMVAVQQFVHIGMHSFIAGGSLVRKNIPPFVKAAREPLSYVGVNSVGMRRRSFTEAKIREIQELYRYLFVRGYKLSKAMEVIETSIPESEEKDIVLSFIRSYGENGLMRGLRELNGTV